MHFSFPQAPLLCRVYGSGSGLPAQLLSAQLLASSIQSIGPQPNPTEIPEGKYLGNGLQTTIALNLRANLPPAELQPWEYPVHKTRAADAWYFITQSQA